MISKNRQLSVATIHQHGKPNGARPTKIAEGVQRGSHGAPRVEHIVHEHHGAAFHVDR
jgi:hypothetical protein